MLGALQAGWRPAAVAVLAGGAIGPLLLVAGRGRTYAATASLLLNVELPATVVLASVVFREHIGRRLAVGALLVSVASVVQAWQPGAAFDLGSLLIVAACVAWAVDNGVTAGIVAVAPEHVVFLKGVIAGGANLAIGLAASGRGERTSAAQVLAALGVGAARYGWSIMLWVKGARDPGSASTGDLRDRAVHRRISRLARLRRATDLDPDGGGVIGGGRRRRVLADRARAFARAPGVVARPSTTTAMRITGTVTMNQLQGGTCSFTTTSTWCMRTAMSPTCTIDTGTECAGRMPGRCDVSTC